MTTVKTAAGKKSVSPIEEQKTTALKELSTLNNKLVGLDRGSAQLPKAESAKLPATASERPKNDLAWDAEGSETGDQLRARAQMHPVVGASSVMVDFGKHLGEHDINATVRELTKHVEAIKADSMNRPEAILVCQAQALDVMFCALARRAANHSGSINVTEAYLRMALKAQAQCRATIETLNEVKNPRQANFIRQQNVAHQQQVNNGVPMPGTSSHAHGDSNANQSNKLLEVSDGKRLDTGAQGTASGTDSELEAVASVNRPENEARQEAR